MTFKVSRLYSVVKQPGRLLGFYRYHYFKWRRQNFPAYSFKRDLQRAKKIMPSSGVRFLEPGRVIAIVGLPRSGTSLLTTMFGNAKDMVALSEPFLQFLQAGFFRWRDLSGEEMVCTRPPLNFINSVVKNGELSPTIVFKETWRSAENDIYPNSAFISANSDLGIQTVTIIRDPRAIWYSHLNFCSLDHSTPPTKFFLQDWNKFSSWAREVQGSSIKYEDLVKNANEIIKILLYRFGLDTTINSKELRPISGLGDPNGLRGGSVNDLSLIKHKALDLEVIKSIEDTCGDEMGKHGYL